MRECKVCNKTKEDVDFTARRRVCKRCYAAAARHNPATKIRSAEYRDRNREAERARIRQYYLDNTDKCLEKSRRYYANNKERIKARAARYTAARRRTDPNFKLAYLLRLRLNNALRGNPREIRLLAGLGVSIDRAREHLESKFQPGMSWGNHGEWHIDHIRPLASFDLTDPDQYRTAAHYTNLQPLWAHDNRKKGSKFTA
jgi:hypothetical protein